MDYKQSEEQQHREGSEVENCSDKAMQECAEENVSPQKEKETLVELCCLFRAS